MSEKNTMKPLALALGAAFVTSLASIPVANAAENPFAMSELSSGYMVAENQMEGGDKAKAEGKCGEGKCGANKAEGEGGAEKAKAEGKCGEGKCGGANKAEGEGGAEKTKAEGKCGEGKCGGEKK
jgi:uncharacterized low-complexity protein